MEEYLETIKEQIRDRHAREFVAKELETHILDQAEDYESSGMSKEEALSAAVGQMGDPVTVGVQMNRIHRPRMEWRFLALVLFLSLASIVVQFFVNTPQGAVAHAAHIGVGLLAMLLVYRLDYTALAGKTRLLFLFLVVLVVFWGMLDRYFDSLPWMISGRLPILLWAMVFLSLPCFAGILYDFRGEGYGALVKAFAWMLLIAMLVIHSQISILPMLAFELLAGMLLLTLAVAKGWYEVNRRIVLLDMWLGTLLIPGLWLFWLMRRSTYQSMRILGWLGRMGISKVGTTEFDYINARLRTLFQSSSLIGTNPRVMGQLHSFPEVSTDYVLGGIAARLGLLPAWLLVLGLVLVSVAIFWISLRQNNRPGYLVGCACGIVFGMQTLSNVMIVTGLLPMTTSFLPLFTSGGVFLLVDYVLLGLILSVFRYQEIRRERPKNSQVNAIFQTERLRQSLHGGTW